MGADFIDAKRVGDLSNERSSDIAAAASALLNDWIIAVKADRARSTAANFNIQNFLSNIGDPQDSGYSYTSYSGKDFKAFDTQLLAEEHVNQICPSDIMIPGEDEPRFRQIRAYLVDPNEIASGM